MKFSPKWFLGMLPAYGANGSHQQYGEPWSGLIAGTVVALLILSVWTTIEWVKSRLSKRNPPPP